MISFIVILVLMMVIAIGLRRLEGSWLAPGSLLAMIWLVMSFSTVLLRPQYLVSTTTLLLISSFIFLFGTGSVFGQIYPKIQIRSCRPVTNLDFPYLTAISLAILVLGIIPSILTIIGYSGSATHGGLLEKYLYIAQAEAVKRYSGKPIYYSFLLIFIYTGPFFGGLLFARNGRLNKVISILTLFPSIFYTFLTTSKACFITATAFWVSSYFSASFFNYGLKFTMLTKRTAFAVITALLIGITFFLCMQLVRDVSIKVVDQFFSRLDSYVFAPLPPLSDWIEKNDLLKLNPSWGRWTIAGVYDFFGFGKREVGIYRDAITIGNYNSNVYTILRGLIQDFTLFGAALITFMAGFVAGKSFKALLCGNIFGFVLLPQLYSLILWSPITSILNYNSTLAALLIFSIYSFFCACKDRQSNNFNINAKTLL